MLLDPITERANFWAMKFISFVVLEQLKQPYALGPLRPTAALKPAVARSRAASHEAGRSDPSTRIIGVVKRRWSVPISSRSSI